MKGYDVVIMICEINKLFKCEIDLSHNILNNLRIMCQKDPANVKRIIPEELFGDIINGYPIPAQIEYYSPSTNKFYELDLTSILSDQLGDAAIRDTIHSEIPAIQITIDGYRTAPNGKHVLIEGNNLPATIKETEQTPGEKKSTSPRDSHTVDDPIGESPTDDKPAKESIITNIRKRKWIIAVFWVLIVLSSVLWFSRDTSVNDVLSLFSKKEYESAIALYNDKVAGNAPKEEKVNPEVEHEINRIFDGYNEDYSVYDDAHSNLLIITGIKNDSLSELATEKADLLSTLEDSRIIYDKGLSSLSDANYLEAIKCFQGVDPAFVYYKDAQNQIEQVVSTIVGAYGELIELADAEEGLAFIEQVLALLPDNKPLNECHNNLIRFITLKKAQSYAEADDYKNVFDIIKETLKKIPDDEELTSHLTAYVAEFKSKMYSKAEKYIAMGKYSDAFATVESAIKILPDDEEIPNRLEEYHVNFENSVIEKANTLVIEEKYDQAIDEIEQAMSVYTSKKFDTLKKEIEGKKAKADQAKKEYTAENVNFITYHGTIQIDDDVNEYTLVAEEDGKYRFDISDTYNGFGVNISVYSPDGSEVADSDYGLETGEGITASLEKGKKYIIKVYQYSDTGSYTLTIGQQKKSIDITKIEILHDSIEFVGQINLYEITAEYGGNYRFDFANVYSGFSANVSVIDDHNYTIADTQYGLENNEGLTAELEAGKTYLVYVYQYESTSSYDFYIGKQSDTKSLTIGKTVSDEITFTGQKNRYDLVSNGTGEYEFVLSDMKNGVEFNISVFDDHNYVLCDSDYGIENGGSCSAKLEKGKKYRVVVYQYSDWGTYKLKVSRAGNE